jgi:hypothetical protein
MVVLTDMGGGSTARRPVTRRAALRWAVAGTCGVLLAGCGGKKTNSPTATVAPTATTVPAAGAVDFSARFAAFQPTDEPNGDLAVVVWPDYVLSAGKDVKQLYEFQVLNGDLMRWMPCFCGCKGDGHRNNRDCYVKSVNPDGTVVFDAMAPT